LTRDTQKPIDRHAKKIKSGPPISADPEHDRISNKEGKMEILVCVKRVPDSAENEIEVKADGSDIKRDDLVYSVNEWDNYAVEEAIQIVDRVGGSVTVVSIGNEEAEEVVRREMAMGANQGLLLVDPAFEGSDGLGLATILKAAVAKGSYDLVLTGAQADDGAAQVGGMLAAMLDWPYASLVNKIEVQEGKTLRIGREVEGGNQEINEIEMPCVLSIQTGINEPRYVGIRGIRKVASVEIPVLNAAALGVEAAAVGKAGAKVQRADYFVPPAGAGAEILQGSADEIAAKLIDLLKSKGGIK
jgi:electron transfer flavoprotein beta subunit